MADHTVTYIRLGAVNAVLDLQCVAIRSGDRRDIRTLVQHVHSIINELACNEYSRLNRTGAVGG